MSAYVPAAGRYEKLPYRRCGRSGLQLPAISLGLWQNFGDDRPLADAAARSCAARSISGSRTSTSPTTTGRRTEAPRSTSGASSPRTSPGLRDEVVISTKAGYDMWPGPYGEWGSRKYLLGSLDQSLARMRLDYVDIFYSHRFDPDTPLEETMGALDSAVRQGKARYVGISSYSPERTEEAIVILRELGTPLLIHQPSYSMFNRWIEDGLLDVLGRGGGRLHRVLAAGAGAVDRQVPRTGFPRTRASRAGSPSRESIVTRAEPRAGPGAGRDRRRPRADARAAGARLGAARPARDVGPDRRQQRRAARAERRRARAARSSSPTSSRRSTVTPSTAVSTSGPRRATRRARSRAGASPAALTDDLAGAVDVGLLGLRG